MIYPHRNITLRQLRAFCAVYEEGSFTRAAEEIHLTQSAVSKLCAELEATLGMTLFERSTRRIKALLAADDLYAHATRVLRSMQELEQGMQAGQSQVRGVLRVSAAPMIVYGLLMPAIQSFSQQFPAVHIHLVECATDETLDAIRRHRVDVGIVSNAQLGADLLSELIYEDVMCLVCPAGHPLVALEKISWDDVVQYDHVALQNHYGVRRVIDQIGLDSGHLWQPHIEAGMLSTVFGLVGAGLGIAIIPRYASEIARQLGLAVLDLNQLMLEQHSIYLLRSRQSTLSAAAEAFREELITGLRQL